VRYELTAGVPHSAGMPRPIDVTVVDRDGSPVSGLSGRIFAIRPSDERLSQRGELVALPGHPGSYRTLVRLDEPGTWDMRLDATQQAMRFVHAARLTLAADAPEAGEGAAR
jgi:nitrogen fixation protein FixH